MIKLIKTKGLIVRNILHGVSLQNDGFFESQINSVRVISGDLGGHVFAIDLLTDACYIDFRV